MRTRRRSTFIRRTGLVWWPGSTPSDRFIIMVTLVLFAIFAASSIAGGILWSAGYR